MKELKGKYNTCKVFTNDDIDESTKGQLTALLDQESLKDCKIRIMPDYHAGAGCVIGTTMTIKDKIIPNLVGVDIGCGVQVFKLKEKRIDLPKLDSVIRKYVPSGFNIHDEPITEFNEIYDLKVKINTDRALRSIGTLGGGNHFIELDRDSEDNLYLVIHTGSRHAGLEVCKYYQDLAYEALRNKNGSLKELSDQLIEKLKSEGREKEISTELAKLKKEFNSTKIDIPHELAYCEGDNFNDYIHDMKIMQLYAYTNRAQIAKTILKKMKLHVAHEFTTMHNYIDTENMILRKGAVNADDGLELIVPMNMRDGSLICVGKGNPDYNYSAPHGAGRIMCRREARETISMRDYKKSMDGIYTTCINKDTIDESAFAYKPMESIIENIKDTVNIVDRIIPIYNFKAGEE